MLYEALFKHAKESPDSVAIVDDTGTYTYSQLANMSAGLSMLFGMKTQKDKIGLLLPASAGFAASYFGALLAKKTVVPINFLLGDREIAHVIKDSGIDTIVTIPILGKRLESSGLNIIDLMSLPNNPGMQFTANFPSVNKDDLAVLMYTSGTSGLPKGVMLTYENIASDVDASIQHIRLEKKHHFLGVIPLFHAFGMTGMMLAPLQLGSKIVYMGRFSAVGAIKKIRENQISVFMGVPSMFTAMLHLKDASRDDFKHMYAVVSGGEPLPTATRDQFVERFGAKIYEGYGLTETSPVVTFNTPHESESGSVGKPVPGAKVRITDENGGEVPQGHTGEIWLAGPMVMKGYYNLPEETARALTPDRYFRTGDLGKIDEKGFLHITGRIKDLIIVSGEKVYPREVEEAILKDARIAEAAVVGKKDPGRGEIVVAFIAAKEGQEITEAQVRDFCGKSGLINWKIPREVHIMKELPKSPTGKVLKRVLSEQLGSMPPQ